MKRASKRIRKRSSRRRPSPYPFIVSHNNWKSTLKLSTGATATAPVLCEGSTLPDRVVSAMLIMITCVSWRHSLRLFRSSRHTSGFATKESIMDRLLTGALLTRFERGNPRTKICFDTIHAMSNGSVFGFLFYKFFRDFVIAGQYFILHYH